MYTRDWIDDTGNHRSMYEMEAVAVGHDLSRGRGRFARNRPTMATSSVEDAEAEHRVHGEATEPVPNAQAPVLPDARPLDDEPGYPAAPVSPAPGYAPVDDDLSGEPDEEDLPRGPVDDEMSGAPDDDEPSGGAVDADPMSGEGAQRPVEPDVDSSPLSGRGGRGGRGRGRVPVPV
jgi:single-strand DNA-binding protein